MFQKGNESRKGTQLLWCEACGVALNSTAQQEMHFSGWCYLTKCCGKFT